MRQLYLGYYTALGSEFARYRHLDHKLTQDRVLYITFWLDNFYT